MITELIVSYQKNGAIFSNAQDAQLDRFVGYDALHEQCVEANTTMKQNGTFTRPILYTWDPINFTLSLSKLITDMTTYNTIWNPLKMEVEGASSANGWTVLPEVQYPVE
jgi:hypothetical protein